MNTNTSKRLRLGAVALLAAGTLAACGSSSTATTAAATQPAAAPSAAPSAGAQGRTGGGFNSAELTKVRECLTAAGITLPTPGPRPSGAAAGADGTPNAGSGPANGGASNGGASNGGASNGFGTGSGRGFGSALRSPAAQAALKACGITLPTRPAGGGAGSGAAAAGAVPKPTPTA